MINVLATVEPRPEDGMNIVNGGWDESWTPFWLNMNSVTLSKQDMFDAIRSVLKRAIEQFKVSDMSDLEMLEMRGIRIFQPHRQDGSRFDDYVIYIRKKAPVS